MALIVEDGTVVPNANSYLDVAGFKSYHDARGQSYGSATDAQIEAALIRAADYIDNRWGTRLAGLPQDSAQALSFPRRNMMDPYGSPVEGVPTRVRSAAAEYALAALSGSLWATTETSDGALVSKKTSTVGPISESVEYVTGTASSVTRAIPAADALIKPFLTPGGLLRT